MTIERRFVAGVGDIKAICFECVTCCARVSRSPSPRLVIPFTCPDCGKSWVIPHNREPVESETSFHNLVRAVCDIKTISENPPFKILFEFDEPNNSRAEGKISE